jgi:hypothetical protein
VRGVLRGVSARRGNRVVCYCDDCQSFAHFLEGAKEILDEHDGTDVFQMSPARLEITEGADRLACMRLTTGGMLRWYTDCCRTPVGNTPASRGVPFVGLVLAFADPASDGRSRDEVFGPVRVRVQARSAKGDRGRLDAYDGFPLVPPLRFVRMLLMARLRGEHRHSPFFDPETGAPRATPRVLTPEQLRAVEGTRDAT